MIARKFGCSQSGKSSASNKDYSKYFTHYCIEWIKSNKISCFFINNT